MTTVKTLSITLAGIAALALTGCGPRMQADASLRMAPVSTPPIASVSVDVRPDAMSPDGGGTAVVAFTLGIFPVLSALAPGMGGSNLEAGGIGGAIVRELKTTHVVSIAAPDKADYLVSGESQTRWQMRRHMSGFGLVWAVGILPAVLGLPHTTWSSEAEADLVVRRRRDGAKIASVDVSRDNTWYRGMYGGAEAAVAESNVSGLTSNVVVQEVAMSAARKIALAIQADMATHAATAPTPAAAPATAPVEAQ